MKIPKPKGILIPIGGHEDKTHNKDILNRVLQESKKNHPKICVITIATNLPDEIAKDYRNAFKDLAI